MAESERRLAAIMFTDMVGYTSLTQRSEDRAMKVLDDHRRVVRPLFQKHNGREVKTMGDAFLVEFPSPLEAVRCAYEIQESFHELNASRPEDGRVMLRIGIHLGDVIHSQDDVYGDAVNVASRIQPLALPGGVCISEQVYDSVRRKFELPFESMGRKELKNVEEPTEVFRLVLPWERAGKEEAPTEPSRVAVLPFANISPDPNDSFFADGVTEELITSLSAVRGLTVIARTSVMKYRNSEKGASEVGKELNAGTLVEGSVRKAANRVRITVQLIDAPTEGHLWAQNYDRELNDIFAIQSEIAESVAKQLKVQLLDSEKQRLASRKMVDTEAYTLYLHGRQHWNIRSKESIEKAIVYFEQAIIRDEKFALGYSGLADCYAVMGRNGLSEFGPSFQKAKEFATRALSIDPDLAEAHATLANILHYYDHDWKGSEAEFKKAIQLNPSYSTSHQWYAHLLYQQRRLDEGEAELATALQLDPFSIAINQNLGGGYYYKGEFDKAIAQFKKVALMDPKYAQAYLGPPGLIPAYMRKGLHDEAMLELSGLGRIWSGQTQEKLWRAYVQAAMGKVEARGYLEEVEANYQAYNVSPYAMALVRFLIGDNDKGFEWLQAALEAHDGSLNLAAVDYELEGARDDPRYKEIIRTIGLEGTLGR